MRRRAVMHDLLVLQTDRSNPYTITGMTLNSDIAAVAKNACVSLQRSSNEYAIEAGHADWVKDALGKVRERIRMLARNRRFAESEVYGRLCEEARDGKLVKIGEQGKWQMDLLCFVSPGDEAELRKELHWVRKTATGLRKEARAMLKSPFPVQSQS